LDESDEEDDRVVFEDGDEGSGTEDSGASSLGDETTTKDEDYESGSDYSEYGSEESEQEEEEEEEEGRNVESSDGSEVPNKDEEESDQFKLLSKVKQTFSSEIKKSDTEHSSKILQRISNNNMVNKVKQVDEKQINEQVDDEYKSDTSDEEVCSSNMVFHIHIYK
jgi:hypothetical protein